MPKRPLRTWLFAPGTDPRKTGKTLASDADALILDLKDAVALSEKPQARQTLRGVLSEVAPERHVYVRVNDLATGMTADDLAAVCTGGLAGMFLPKIESAEAVRLVRGLMDSLGHGLPRADPADRLGRTARGVLNLPQIAGGRLDVWRRPLHHRPGHPHREHRASHSERQHPDRARLPGERAPAHHRRGLFRRDRRRGLPRRLPRAEARGIGAVQVDGKLIEYPMVHSAERVLATVRALGLACAPAP